MIQFNISRDCHDNYYKYIAMFLFCQLINIFVDLGKCIRAMYKTSYKPDIKQIIIIETLRLTLNKNQNYIRLFRKA